GLLQEDGGGRALDDELEGAVRVDGDDHRQDQAAHLLGAVVELRHELADVDAVLAQRGADRRRRRRLAARALPLDLGRYRSRHGAPFPRLASARLTANNPETVARKASRLPGPSGCLVSRNLVPIKIAPGGPGASLISLRILQPSSRFFHVTPPRRASTP